MSQYTSSAVMQQRSEPHEKWRAIEGWPGYEVSDHGRVRSWKQRSRTVRCTWEVDYSKTPRVLKPDTRNGYPSVLLIKNGIERRWFSLHRLVLEVFVGHAPEGCEAAHGDGDKANNHVDNLRWATHIENERDKVAHGTILHGEKVGTSRLTFAQVIEIKTRRSSGEKTKDLAAMFGVCRNTITNITRGHYWKGVSDGAK